MQITTKFYLGIDVSKHWFDLSLLTVINHQKQIMVTERFDNNEKGIKEMEQWLKKQNVSFNDNTLLVIENTGIYHRPIWEFCSTHGLPIHIGNAAHIKWSFGIARGKNDVIDSQRLCNYAHKHADELKATPELNPVFIEPTSVSPFFYKLTSTTPESRRLVSDQRPTSLFTPFFH